MMTNLELAQEIYFALEAKQFDMDSAGFIAVIESVLDKDLQRVAALTAERDGLREAHQELSRLAREVSRMYSGTSWNVGAIRKLTEYIDNQTKTNPRGLPGAG